MNNNSVSTNYETWNVLKHDVKNVAVTVLSSLITNGSRHDKNAQAFLPKACCSTIFTVHR